MDPLLAFAALSTNVKHAAASQLRHDQTSPKTAVSQAILLNAQLAHLESSFVYAGGFRSRPKYVHLVRQVVRPDYPLGLLEETVGMTISISDLDLQSCGVLKRRRSLFEGGGGWRSSITHYSAESIK